MKDIENILDTLGSYNPEANLDLVRKAHDHAASALAGLTLRNGAPTLSRSLAVAHTLSLLRVDETVIAAGLVYDTALMMDGGSDPCEDIRKNFGSEVAAIVAGAIKADQMRFSYAEQRGETLRDQQPEDHIRKLQLALSEDVRVLLVILAYRMHELLYLGCQPQHRQERIARETRDIYLPLVHRLGLGAVEDELEDRIFRHLQPEAYHRIRKWLEKRRPSDETHIREVSVLLHDALETTGIDAAIKGGVKPIHSIHTEHTAPAGLDLDEIDTVIVTVIVKNTQECYEALGLAYSIWKPVPGRFGDFIASPAVDMRRGLRTTVLGPRMKRAELLIRTEGMHSQAERGMLSCWWNEDGGLVKLSHRPDHVRRFDELRELLELVQYQRPDFDPEPPIWDPLSDIIVVFTPNGALQELPRGATPVDFAYRIHTELGNHCIGAKVNGKLSPLHSELHSSDIVEIIISAKGHPSRDWLSFVKTEKARKRIRRFVRMEENSRSIAQGRDLLKKLGRRLGISIDQNLTNGELARVAAELGFSGTDELFSAIGYGKIAREKVLRLFQP